MGNSWNLFLEDNANRIAYWSMLKRWRSPVMVTHQFLLLFQHLIPESLRLYTYNLTIREYPPFVKFATQDRLLNKETAISVIAEYRQD